MRIFKRAAGFIAVNVIVVALMTFMLSMPSILNLVMKEAKNGECSTLIVGQSHAEVGYDPYVMSDVLGDQTFNLARSSMPIVNISYLIEEANSNGQYKRIIWDLDPLYWVNDHKGRVDTDTNLLFSLTGDRWFGYIKNVLMKDNYNTTFVDYMVFWGTIKRIPQNLKLKLNKAYLTGDVSYIPDLYSAFLGGAYEYKGRGFRYGLRKSGKEWSVKDFDENCVKQENIEAFKKIVAYCKANDIELVCAQAAVTPHRLQHTNMDAVHEYVSDLCNEYGIPFYDLNYLKSEYLARTDDDYVDLEGHMMGHLAERQSAVLGRILLAEDKDAFFYDTYEDVLAHLN